MTKEYIQENNVIEQYLLNQLSDEERKAFRAALLFDEELRQEVEDSRLLYQHIQQLKPKTVAGTQPLIQKRNNNRNRYLLGLLIIGLLVVGFFLVKGITSNNTIIEKENTSTEATRPSDAEFESESNPEENSTDRPNEIEEDESTAPINTNEPKKDEIDWTKQPIAAADIAPHPYLDQFTEGAFRNDVDEIEITSPNNASIPLKDGKARVQVTGKILTKAAIEKERYTIRIFTNKKADFDSFKPIISGYPNLKKETGGYSLNFQSILPLSRGLYYFVIEDSEIEDMAYVGKFMVE